MAGWCGTTEEGKGRSRRSGGVGGGSVQTECGAPCASQGQSGTLAKKPVGRGASHLLALVFEPSSVHRAGLGRAHSGHHTHSASVTLLCQSLLPACQGRC